MSTPLKKSVKNRESDEIKKYSTFCWNHIAGYQFYVLFFPPTQTTPRFFSFFHKLVPVSLPALCHFSQWPHTLNTYYSHFVEKETEALRGEARCLDMHPGLTSELRLFVIRPRCLPASCPLLHFSGGWLSWWLSDKESACNAGAAGDAGLIPGSSGRSPGGRQGNLLQYSCLENPMDRGAWWAGYSPEVRKQLNTIEAT